MHKTVPESMIISLSYGTVRELLMPGFANLKLPTELMDLES
jgi:hypothetical protein